MSDRKSDIEETLADDAKLTAIAKAVFDAIDTDGSGQIDRSELKNAMINISKQKNLNPPTEDQIDDAMAKLDTDHSGTIDVIEFKEMIRQLLEAIIAD
jgi:Ca2+-binding EF-hand superfamily protein